MENLTSCAVIFCGGRGSRLGSIGEKKNKSLLLVKNKPIIGHIIDQLLKAKIDKIILPLGYRGKDIKNILQKVFQMKFQNLLLLLRVSTPKYLAE